MKKSDLVMHKLTSEHKYINSMELGITPPRDHLGLYLVCAVCKEPAPFIPDPRMR